MSLNQFNGIESWLLKQPGPSLSSCRNQSGLNEIFMESQYTSNIIFQKDVHSNIRAYYYSLLQISSELQRKFKNILYSQQTRPDQFQIPSLKSKHKQFYNNISLKRLIVQMLLQIKIRKKKSAVKQIFNQYPIMDLVMMLLMRSIIYRHRNIKIPILEKIPTRVIAECFWELFQFGSYQTQPSVWKFQIINYTYNSNGAYQQIRQPESFDDLKQKFTKTKLSILQHSFCTIQEVSKEDSYQGLKIQQQLQNSSQYNKQNRKSVTSSLQSIHLKLKSFDFQDSLSQISRRQSLQEDSFIERIDTCSQKEVCLPFKFFKGSTTFIQNSEPNRTLNSPLRRSTNFINKQ